MRSDQATQYRDYLIDINALAQADLLKIVRLAERHPDVSIQVLMEMYPEVLAGYVGASEDLGRVMLVDHAPGITPVAGTSMPTDEQIRNSIAWAVNSQADTYTLLGGAMQRSIFNGSRWLVQDSIDLAEPGTTTTTWARHASATACGFCRMLATRGDVYQSKAAASTVVGRGKEMTDLERIWRGGKSGPVQELGTARFIAGGVKARGTRSLGSSYHDHCRCIAVPSTTSDPYVPPAYVADWMNEYELLAKEADREGLSGNKKTNYVTHRLAQIGEQHRH